MIDPPAYAGGTDRGGFVVDDVLLPREGYASSLEEFVKAGVIPKGAYSWVYANIGQTDSILFVCLHQPAVRLVRFTQQRIDYSNFICRYPVLVALGDEFREDFS